MKCPRCGTTMVQHSDPTLLGIATGTIMNPVSLYKCSKCGYKVKN